MAKILGTETQIKIVRFRVKEATKITTKFFGTPLRQIEKDGLYYGPALDSIRLGNACIPMSNLVEYEIAE